MRDGEAGGGAELRRFSSDGVDIAFIDVKPQGQDLNEPILLVHGFASNHRMNWVGPRWARHAHRALGAASSRSTIAATGKAKSSTLQPTIASI